MNKQQVHDLVDALPDEIDYEELTYQLYLLRKIEIAEQSVRDGKLIPHEEVVRESETWLS